MKTTRNAQHALAGLCISLVLAACGGDGSSDDGTSGSGTSENTVDTVLSLSQVSDIPVLDLCQFDVRGTPSATKGLVMQTSVARSQETGDPSIGGCHDDAVFNEAARQSAIAAAYTCYVQTAAALKDEIKIGNNAYAYYSLTVPALSTGQSVGATNKIEWRIGKFDSDTIKMDTCLNSSLVAHYDVTANSDTASLSGTVVTSAKTQTYTEMNSIAFDITFKSVSKAPTSGDFSYQDVDTAHFDLAFDGGNSQGELAFDDLGDGTAMLEGFATLTSANQADQVTAQIVAEVNDAVGTVDYRVEGYYAALSVDELVALGVEQSALDTGKSYCFDPNVKAVADAAMAAGASCDTANNPACYGLVESKDDTCTFDIESSGNSFDVAQTNFPIVDDSESPFVAAVSGSSLPQTQTVSISFGSDAWDCKADGTFTDINLAQDDFSSCTAYLSTAFPDSLPQACMRTIDSALVSQ